MNCLAIELTNRTRTGGTSGKQFVISVMVACVELSHVTLNNVGLLRIESSQEPFYISVEFNFKSRILNYSSVNNYIHSLAFGAHWQELPCNFQAGNSNPLKVDQIVQSPMPLTLHYCSVT